MLIASTDPLIVFYHDGFIRMSMVKYDKNSKDVNLISLNFQKANFFANTALSEKYFKDEKFMKDNGFTSEE
jgi:hypothetical protein